MNADPQIHRVKNKNNKSYIENDSLATLDVFIEHKLLDYLTKKKKHIIITENNSKPEIIGQMYLQCSIYHILPLILCIQPNRVLQQ